MPDYRAAISLASLTEGKILITKIESHTIAITLINGEPKAFQSLCPHEKAGLQNARIENCEILCPRHFARFNLNTGEVSAGWRVDNLKLYPARISDDNMVEVDLEALNANPPEGTKKTWDMT